MMDLRYHLVSLIAVFLALAAGVVMGAALTGSEKQEQQVRQIQDQFESLRQQDQQIADENRALRQRLELWGKVGRELRVAALRNALARQPVGIIVCGASAMPDYWTDLRATLATSGALEGPVVFVPDDLNPVQGELRRRLVSLWGEPSAAGRIEPAYEALFWLLRGLATPAQAGTVQELARWTGVRLQGDTSLPARRFLVLVAPPDEDRAQRAAGGDLPEFALADAARAAGARMVIAEEEGAERPIVAKIASRGVPTVDNIETVIGQTAAVLAMNAAPGAYGVKSGSAGPLPRVVE